MYVFGNDQKARGCFHIFNIHEGISQGATLTLPTGNELPIGIIDDPFIVTGVEFAQKEKYHLVECFNDTVHTYAFGFDPKSSLITVNFVGSLMEKDGSAVGDYFDILVGAYSRNRLVESQELATVTFGSKGIVQGFVVAMSTSTSDPAHNLQNFSIVLLAVEAQTGSVGA